MTKPTVQQHIQEVLHVLPRIDADQEIRRRVDFLKSYLLSTKAEGYVLGISGGQDSTLTGKLAQIAVDELNQEITDPTGIAGEGYRFITVRLPYGVQQDEADAQMALSFIQPSKNITVNIQPAVDASAAQFEQATGEKLSDFLKGNIKARERMKVQYDLAAHYRMLVLGTDHAAEAVSGFFTKHGDGACDAAPIFGLNKRQGKELLKHLGCPELLYLKKPTADLEDLKPGLPDEVALGVTYEEIDTYLEGGVLSDAAKDIIERRYQRTEHKRNAAVTVYDEWWKERL
ncbi:ammonia-dependent NAD(+) synthetase [Paenibacillus sp. WQ 127069]|uniref:NH(3)-dependent NAD(+) synthetase n=1 Tax=Paenibacillus baimaensis TaxID=2982185 RepID=A0ABT2USX2_9BACL|nr:ammonia-dependent NAD(+) synthetase [Paenibacillus sp. WQ 127069]MCU6797773.1 ammonia-dependent NAD(+) synthetase [Paenibacillus sp. WQ 127069]